MKDIAECAFGCRDPDGTPLGSWNGAFVFARIGSDRFGAVFLDEMDFVGPMTNEQGRAQYTHGCR